MLLRKEYEFITLLVEYDRAIIQEGVISGEERILHKWHMESMEKRIKILRDEINSILSNKNDYV